LKTTHQAWFTLLLLGAGCLPKDTRPPPARVLMTASPSPMTESGIASGASADGWAISFDRIVLVLGRASLDGDTTCSTYSEARYTRVLSLLGAPAGQKISESFALGQCDFGFGVSNAESDSLLGVGATVEDLSFLRQPGADPYAGPSGTSLFVAGHAENGEQTKTFAWAFRGRVRYRECKQVVDGMPVRGLELEQNEDVTVDIGLHPEALFADDLDDTKAVFRFAAFAEADTTLGNDDGEVTLEELSLVPLATLQQTGVYGVGDVPPDAFTTFEDFVYLGLAPKIARYRDDGTCTVRLGEMRGD
jgi:hypothetical protein